MPPFSYFEGGGAEMTRRGVRRKTRVRRPTIQGTLRADRPGHMRVVTAEGVFPVARRGLREGMNGDEVLVSLVPMHGRRGVPVAYVQGVIGRACTEFVGSYAMVDPLGVVTPLDGRLGHDFFVLPQDTSARRLGVEEGDLVRARIVEYPTRSSSGVVTLQQRLGSAEGLDLGVEGVIASHGLASEFGQSALDEADGVEARVDEALRREPQRRDLRDAACVTIDPADARDFDDAVGARIVDGGYELDVHIADVTSYVPVGSAMDAEARRRTCSVYLVDRVLPMLPERLCNDVCSLRPHEDRLSMSVRVRLDERGEVRDFETFASAIRSNARLSYDEVDSWLEGRDVASPAAEVGKMLDVLDRVANLRREVRRRRGSIDFETTESKVLLDGGGRPVDIVVRRRTRATSLVEEAMLVANECVAKLLADHGVATAYRVHERPAPEDLKACVPQLAELGLLGEVGAERLVAGEPEALQAVLDAARGTSGEILANALLLHAQKRALYLPRNEGHYALGARAYCHFTSPIRRYPDVLVHRALKNLLAQAAPSSEEERALPQLCRTCSDQERVADKAAHDSQSIKMAEYYGERIGMKASGVVISCERYGSFVRLDDTGAEGLLPARELTSERVWYPGKHVAVKIADVDVGRGHIDFELA